MWTNATEVCCLPCKLIQLKRINKLCPNHATNFPLRYYAYIYTLITQCCSYYLRTNYRSSQKLESIEMYRFLVELFNFIIKLTYHKLVL